MFYRSESEILSNNNNNQIIDDKNLILNEFSSNSLKEHKNTSNSNSNSSKSTKRKSTESHHQYKQQQQISNSSSSLHTKPVYSEIVSSKCIVYIYYKGDLSNVIDDHFKKSFSINASKSSASLSPLSLSSSPTSKPAKTAKTQETWSNGYYNSNQQYNNSNNYNWNMASFYSTNPHYSHYNSSQYDLNFDPNTFNETKIKEEPQLTLLGSSFESTNGYIAAFMNPYAAPSQSPQELGQYPTTSMSNSTAQSDSLEYSKVAAVAAYHHARYPQYFDLTKQTSQVDCRRSTNSANNFNPHYGFEFSGASNESALTTNTPNATGSGSTGASGGQTGYASTVWY